MRLFEAFAQTARQWSSKTAIISPKRSVSYQELLKEVEHWEQQLRAAQIHSPQALGFSLGNEIDFISILLALNKMNLTSVPIDCELKENEINQIHTQTQLLKTHTIAGLDFKVGTAHSKWRNIAMIQFTSGSTGKPKGILIGDEAMYLRPYNLACSLGLVAQDKTLCTVPLSHSHGIDCLALPTLLCGATLYLRPSKTTTPMTVLDIITQEKITFFSSIPAFYDFSLKIATHNSSHYNLSSLRLPFCGSAALSLHTAQTFYQQFGVSIKQGYGLAEVGVICLNMHTETPIAYESVGKPITGIEAKLIVNEKGEQELVVRSQALYSGYVSAELEDPQPQTELPTGDLVTQDSFGRFFILGRKNDFINNNGLKVFPIEVETLILENPAIRECAVIALREPSGNEVPVAYLVAMQGLNSAEQDKIVEQIKQTLTQRLADYKMPRSFTWLNEFPKSPLGKILRSKICPS